jgi:hypothetical protein
VFLPSLPMIQLPTAAANVFGGAPTVSPEKSKRIAD